MNKAELKRQRSQSILKEVLPEALCSLDDEMLNSLCVIDVECSRGRYDAKVYLDKMDFSDKEQNYILAHLKKASSLIETHCATTLGWFRSPKFSYKFDDRLEHQNKMDELFKKVALELEKGRK